MKKVPTSNWFIRPCLSDAIETYRTLTHSLERYYIKNNLILRTLNLVYVGHTQKRLVARRALGGTLQILSWLKEFWALRLKELAERIVVLVGDAILLHQIVVVELVR